MFRRKTKTEIDERNNTIEQDEIEEVEGCYRTLDYLGVENVNNGNPKISFIVEGTHKLFVTDLPKNDDTYDIVEELVDDIQQDNEEVSVDAIDLISNATHHQIFGFSLDTNFLDAKLIEDDDNKFWGRLTIPTRDGIHTLRVGELTEVLVLDNDSYTKYAEIALKHVDTPVIRFKVDLATWVDSSVLSEEIFKAYVTSMLFEDSTNIDITDIFKRSLTKYISKSSQNGVSSFSLDLGIKQN